MSDKPFFITTPIYYINSVPHVGHAYTQIAADARARFERQKGRRVYFLTGTDENALKVSRVAQEQGRDPLEFCDELAAAFKNVWDKLNISYDDFIRTTEERHKKPVQKVVQKLWDDGHLKLDTYSGWYSVPDETFFRKEDTVERDGAHYIANPTEDQSKAPLEWVEEVGHFFQLSKFGEPLLEYYAKTPQMLLPETRRNETLSFIKSGLRDTSISRVQDWGIPVPSGVPESEGHVIYVWFPDALLNYATAPGYLSDDPEKAAQFAEIWPPDLQLMSKDIFTRFHATLWPALHMALGLELPKQLFAHGFWTVNGRKISKRDPETIVEPINFSQQISDLSGCEFGVAVDALRYYCLREVSFGVDGDFSTSGCFARYNADLANGLGNLVQRAIVMVHKYFEGKAPLSSGQDLGLISQLESKQASVEKHYSELSFHLALADIWEVIGNANKLIEEQKPWVKAKEGQLSDVADLLCELFAAIKWCAVTLYPVMPTSAAKLWSAIGLDSEILWEQATQSDFSVGHEFPAAQPLFPRADLAKLNAPAPKEPKQKKKNKMDETQNNSTASEAVVNAAPAAAPAPVEAPAEVVETPNYISIDDFVKVELKIGQVLEAERVPKADKLLRLQVDLGTEKRQVLAGMAQYYTPEEIVGKSVVVVTNLAPRTMRGYESQGMILAASDDAGNLSLISPISTVNAGGVVK
jgi:methionyl-tRNA synthetase